MTCHDHPWRMILIRGAQVAQPPEDQQVPELLARSGGRCQRLKSTVGEPWLAMVHDGNLSMADHGCIDG